jgi:ferredoxin
MYEIRCGPRRVFLPDHHMLLAEGFEVVGEASSVREALIRIGAAAPEAVTLDISLLDGSGVEVLKQIRRRGWKFSVVVLTGNLYEALLHCIRCGACLNVCPIFRNVGGQTYGTTYQGPIGSVITPHLRGTGIRLLHCRRGRGSRGGAGG